jgi:tetratricopeptide (TPR) repeat protein/transcriptional regulator with XRE-family HTH domain
MLLTYAPKVNIVEGGTSRHWKFLVCNGYFCKDLSDTSRGNKRQTSKCCLCVFILVCDMYQVSVWSVHEGTAVSQAQERIQPRPGLVAARNTHKWSQVEVADQLGTTPLTISRWERGLTLPSLYYRELLVQLFNTSLAALDLEEAQSGSSSQESVLAPPPVSGRQIVLDHTIPIPQSWRLQGRDQLLAELKAGLRSGDSFALCALEGLPGVGKTALAIELAYDPEVRAGFPDGVLWAGLGPDPNLLSILARWGTLLGIGQEQMPRLTGLEAWAVALRETIGQRTMLLLLDDAWSIEHALQCKVGGPNCSYVLTTRSRVIATSFAGSQVTQVGELGEQESLTLLADLTGTLDGKEQEAIENLVQRLGGLPLALVLIGRYLRLVASSGQPRRLQAALEQLSRADVRLQLSELRGPLERHTSLPAGTALSLQAVIAASVGRLPEPAQAALYALSVFPAKPNSFSEEAALAIANCSVDTLDTLFDVGLLESSVAGRYTLHQAIADYASGSRQSDCSQEERLVNYYAAFLQNSAQAPALLELEISNIFTALQSACDMHLQAPLVRMVRAFYPFLQTRGLYRPAKQYLVHASAYARSLGERDSLAQLLAYQGEIQQKLGEYVQAALSLQESLALARALGNARLTAQAQATLGWVLRSQGNYSGAETLLKEGVTLARKNALHEQFLSLLQSLGSLELSLGNYDLLQDYYEEGLAVARELDDPNWIAAMLTGLSTAVSEIGNLALAAVYGQEALTYARRTGNRERIGILLNNLADNDINQGSYARAEAYLQESLDISRGVGFGELQVVVLSNLSQCVGDQGRYLQAEGYAREALELAQRMGYRDRISAALDELARALLGNGQYEQAKEALEDALRQAEELNRPETVGFCLRDLGQLATAQGHFAQADGYLRDALEVASAHNQVVLVGTILNVQGALSLAIQRLEDADATFTALLARCEASNNQKLLALAQYGLARVAAARGEREKAHRLGQTSLMAFEAMGHVLSGEVREFLTTLG